MRVINLIENRNQYLYEGLENAELRSVKLWESAGYAIREAALTSDQIQSLFAEIEKGATAAGGNRTLLGKGKDAAEAVNKAWEDLKTKVQDSKPIKAVDQKYDQAVAKIEAGLGGPDNAVSKIIMGYRKFAKEHPVAQGLIYAALIAAAGISGAGLGGAAVLGLLKMTDKLLQGEKFSSAAYSGAKTGATAYGASKLGDLIKGKPEGPLPNGPDGMPPGLSPQEQKDWLASQATDAGKAAGGTAYQIMKNAERSARDKIMGAIDAGDINPGDTMKMRELAEKVVDQVGGSLSPTSHKIAVERAVMSTLKSIADMNGGTMTSVGGKMVTQSIERSGTRLSEGQVYMVINRVCAQQLDEGIWDSVKGAAGKAVDWAKTKGKNLTTTITADKLNSAWQKAGAPTDSEELKQFLTSQGVEAGVIDSVYNTLKISSGAAEEPVAKSMYAQIKKDVQTLDKKGRQRIMAYLQKQLGTA
jgi:hypothetical protein